MSEVDEAVNEQLREMAMAWGSDNESYQRMVQERNRQISEDILAAPNGASMGPWYLEQKIQQCKGLTGSTYDSRANELADKLMDAEDKYKALEKDCNAVVAYLNTALSFMGPTMRKKFEKVHGHLKIR